ncbi:MAG: hypothetical protein Q8P01_01580 [bacterium]|nr:hypothetical protein [bacterium]
MRHCRTRFRERYGFNISPCMYAELVRKAREGRVLDVQEQQGFRIKCSIQVKGVRVRAVYDKRTKLIVTFLPLEDEE